ncbi:ABC transporter ATP-binding protein [Caldibacillus lycopersici]|uniref:ABC transporter ATP-binding protein n=1 Tax=Perspicuibacillus lycopersici TaxID=1325689 RepID=A0AAE3IVQ5_9BACI|nr:ABC transporter ATP-binding protein [Perspicuibacillus lycopersici]MCU9615092.1 ABC transporter ATP-binding protein [Perspicuibacillus lycopersici]
MENVIEIQNVKKSYRKKGAKEKVEAVKGVSLTVKKGEIVGLLGPNGAGKTTLIKMMCGLLIPNEGTILINGINIRQKRLQAMEHISVVLEGNRNLYWRLTVKENLEYFAGNRGHSKKQIQEKMEHLIDRFNLREKENEMVNALSRGMQQKVAVAVALIANTDVIFLDEPTLGLDLETSYEIRTLLKEIVEEEQKTIIISTHDMPVVQEVCERVVIVNHGNIVADDRVENLLQLFESKAYLFTLNATLTKQQISFLETHFVTSISQNDVGQTLLEVNIQQSEDFYRIIDLLAKEQIPIEKIDRTTVDFEEVFMKIVKGGYSHEMAKSV